MPMAGVEHDRHGRLARVKPRSSKEKDRDSDSRSTISSVSTGSRRHRDSSSSSGRTTLLPDSGQQALNPDQLPKLPESESSSPSTASSPLSRTISTVSESPSTALTSPASLRTPASLQPYLEDFVDLPDRSEDSQATPKPEKPKEQVIIREETSKSRSRSVDETASSSSQTSSCDTVRARPAPSPPRADSSPTSKQKQSPRDSQRLDTMQSDYTSVMSRSNTPSTVSQYNYGHIVPGQQIHPDPYYPYYQQIPPGAGPVSIPQNIPSQPMSYYPEYAPPPAPTPPQQMQRQYPPAQVETSRDQYAMHLLQRVDRAIPDLQLLMNSYHEVYGSLEASETQVRNMEAQRAGEKQKVDSRFSKMEKEIRSLIDKHTTEKKATDLEISTIETRNKELQRKLKTVEKKNEGLDEANQSLRTELKDVEKKHMEDKAALTKDFALENLEKDKMTADHRTNQREMHDQLQGTVRKLEANHAYQVAELSRGHEEEKQHIEGIWAKHRRDLEDRHAKNQREIQGILDEKQKVMDEERRSFIQAREGWDRDRELMVRRWDEERSVLQKTWDEQRKTLAIRHQREKDDLMKQFAQAQSKTENHDTVLSLQREIESLRLGWESDRFKFHKATTDFKTTARTFNDQNSRLQKLTEAFEESTEPKSKRDSLR
ncbi:hypothetical protein P7C71_g2276, partial [Lecanoromycetidae sp. Uapishka_2]